ncbi:BMC domain-containing protein [Clostridium lacusfryxellense]|uniref:BMC domain-containing protein n=1 Tax=Clostridium lacusfryxellense TaxID=205328 RepID=UPI001C0BE329|nr:BMC domain-containing protein [Clostridium lacusfryxellense]MBU3112752.1 BMC domain-containing protein [Clostridium lacusfryxellense]
MDKAIALIEYITVPCGIRAADKMVKTADVEIMEAQTVCPGKYMVLICGNLSAVNAAIDSGRLEFEENIIDSFILGNPHDSIFTAISGVTDPGEVEALGIIETFSGASIIVAADTAAKTAKVNLIEIRISRGMCGKSYLMMSGEIAAVEASVAAACINASASGMLLDKAVIARPDPKLWEKLL